MTTAQPTPTSRDEQHALLGIYLNDHLAGATAGLELFRRATRAHRRTATGDTLERLTREIIEDREALLGFMRALAIPVRQYKVYGAWAAEKVGRLKLNGRLLQRSPLSSVVELEAMRLGVEGKGSGWRTLLTVAENDQRLDTHRLHELRERAGRQIATLEELRVQAVKEVFGGS